MNDASDLYVLITPRGRHGRGLLSGSYRQDVALWFLSPDQKSRVWGLFVPYSRLDQLASGTAPADAVAPVYLTAQDAQVSTAPMPAGVSFHLELDERKPMIELRIALKNIPSLDDRAVPLDFTTTPVSPVIAAQIRNEKPAAAAAPEGGRRRRRAGGAGFPPGQDDPAAGAPGETPDEVPGTPPEAPTVPDTLDLTLSVLLASGPQ
jgi:hypothetical protein